MSEVVPLKVLFPLVLKYPDPLFCIVVIPLKVLLPLEPFPVAPVFSKNVVLLYYPPSM